MRGKIIFNYAAKSIKLSEKFCEQLKDFFKPKCYCRREELFSTTLMHGQYTSFENSDKIEIPGLCKDFIKAKTIKMRDSRLEQFMKDFIFTDSQVNEIYKRLDVEIRNGLGAKTNPEADIKCFITYVHNLPTGKELGKCLALDLGGTNFRVLLVHLKGPKDATSESTIYAIPQEIMTGSGTRLFDHIAECLAIFVKERGLEKDNLPLGFTFSFPCTQVGVQSAILKTWTKGFKASGVENEDIGRLFNEAVARRGDIQVRLVAILNDTTGTLMSCAHRNPNCRIGVIVGTGCNSCYVEKVENVELLEEIHKRKHSHVIINTEWGAFGDNGSLDFVRTQYDKYLDKKSINPGSQIYEKMISGMYLGELTRIVFLEAIEHDLFSISSHQSEVIEKLRTPQLIKTLELSLIEADTFPEFKNTKEILNKLLAIEKPGVEDCLKMKYICECVGRRAAMLAGIGVSVLLNKVEEPAITVGIDGTLYRKHPKFYLYMAEALKKLVDPKKSYDIMISEDGSGLGAAVVAAVENTKFQ